MRKQLVMVLGLLACFDCCFAVQTRDFTENAQVPLTIARDNLTKIVVRDDRIAEVRGLGDYYHIKNDPNEGSLFIEPDSENDKPFTLFVSTEKARHLMLNITPSQVGSDTIVLRYGALKKPQHGIKPKPITASALLNAMQQGVVPIGFTTLDSNVELPPVGNIAPTLITQYQGERFKGQVIRLVNVTALPQKLVKDPFSCRRCVAIALNQAQLPPYTATTLYRVVRYGN